MRREKSFRGISKRLAVHYLEAMGGQALDVDGDPVANAGETPEAAADVERVESEEWTATLSTERVGIGPTLELTEVRIVFEGSAETVDPLVERFAKKAMRAGG